MENSLSSFLILVVTLLIGLVVVSFTSLQAAQLSFNAQVSSFADRVSAGLQLVHTYVLNSGDQQEVVLVPTDFNYKGVLYITVFYTSPDYYGNPDITPASPFISGYGEVNGSTGTTQTVTVYGPSLQELYQGTLQVWTVKEGTAQVISFPEGKAAMVWVMVQTQEGLVQVGYTWLQ